MQPIELARTCLLSVRCADQRAMEPDDAVRRRMTMKGHVRAIVASLPLLASVVSCSADEPVAASCTLDAHITFNGQAYIPVESLPQIEDGGEIRLGKRLGKGELGTCPGEPERQVEVYKVVGVAAERAVFSKPDYGLMKRLEPGVALE
jgi:hypothetical protein